MVFAATVFVMGQVPMTQDGINATIFERMAGILTRLDRVESYLTAAIVALIANSIAHVINIRSSHVRRTKDDERWTDRLIR